MLKEERWDKILLILEEEIYISAEELSKRLYVSLPTIRRDLAELQRKKQIIRSHGGAKKVDTEHTVTPLDFRKTRNYSEKRKLCFAASKLICDNDIIFLDASTTVLQMAEFLTDKKNITVLTNGIPLAMLLSKKGIHTYCTGGELQESSWGYAGSYAEDFVRNFNIDLMFFSSLGISSSGMIVDASEPETRLRKSAMKAARQTIFLCDHTKFGQSAPYNLTDITQIDCIITDNKEIPNEFSAAVKEKFMLI